MTVSALVYVAVNHQHLGSHAMRNSACRSGTYTLFIVASCPGFGLNLGLQQARDVYIFMSSSSVIVKEIRSHSQNSFRDHLAVSEWSSPNDA